MKKLAWVLTLFLALGFSNELIAQDNAESASYDLVYLTKGGVLKGNIQSFDDASGGLTLKDISGKVYSLSREEYVYYKENVVFPAKKKDIEIRPRKDNEFAFHIGFGLGGINVNHDFTPDDYFLGSWEGGYFESMVTVQLAGGKYLSRENYVGATAEFTLAGDAGLFNAGVRFTHQYDAYKRNVAFYIPVEAKYNSLTFNSNYSIADTFFYDANSWSYPSDINYDISQTSLSFGIGQGVSFILEDKKSVDVELMLSKHFNQQSAVNATLVSEPNSEYDLFGLKLSLLYSL